MKITTVETVDVVVEVNVDIDAVLEEAEALAGDADAEHWRQAGPALTAATRVLEAVSDEAIASFPAWAKTALREMLTTQAARYTDKETT